MRLRKFWSSILDKLYFLLDNRILTINVETQYLIIFNFLSQAKLLPRQVLSLWIKWVREQAQLTKWTAEDLLGRSAVGSAHAVQLTIMGLTCREIHFIDALDILPVILHYRHEFYALRKFSPDLSFPLSLRSCFLDKVVSYLRIKRSLNGNENHTHGNILSELSPGEIIGIGGNYLHQCVSIFVCIMNLFMYITIQ